MTDRTATSPPPTPTGGPPGPAGPWWASDATTIAAAVRDGSVTATAVLESCLERIGQVEPALNALVWPMTDRARKTAERIDRWRAGGDPVGPLAGVPISIKECYHVADTPATMGLTARRDRVDREDGLFVRRLLAAGAVPVGKTNVPLLMIYPESENPLYGATRHPLDPTRSPGGSSGGEAALIAAGGSVAGLANDLGGSIRVPAGVCGLAGLKPTGGRLPRVGAVSNLDGMEGLLWQAGPIARTVADCETIFRVLAGETSGPDGPAGGTAPGRRPADGAPWEGEHGLPAPSSTVDVSRLRLGVMEEDGYFPVATAQTRAVREAAAALKAAGAAVVPLRPQATREMLTIYLGLMSADGGAGLRRWLAGSRSNATLRRLLLVGRIPGVLRGPIGRVLRVVGRGHEADLILWARTLSADGLRRLTAMLAAYRRRVLSAWDEAGLDGLIVPVTALPALPHGLGADLIPAGSLAYLANALNVPAGVVPVTRVAGAEAEADASAWTASGRDRLVRLAGRAMAGSAGLPVGVQVLARPWREDVVLAAMAAVEARVTVPRPWERG